MESVPVALSAAPMTLTCKPYCLARRATSSRLTSWEGLRRSAVPRRKKK